MGERAFQVINPGTVVGGIALAMFLGILLFLAVGRRIGRRTIARHGAAGLSNVGSLETAVFALLGLLIAFTFSGALARFDVRAPKWWTRRTPSAPLIYVLTCWRCPRNRDCARPSGIM